MSDRCSYNHVKFYGGYQSEIKHGPVVGIVPGTRDSSRKSKHNNFMDPMWISLPHKWMGEFFREHQEKINVIDDISTYMIHISSH